MIALDNLSKKFGSEWAVHPLALEVPRGSMFGLLGHNGAGKSTIIGMILGQVFPSDGSVTVNGEDVFRERCRALSRVGAIFETPAFYDYLSGLTNLRIFCNYTSAPSTSRLEEIIRLLRLEDCIQNRVSTYSHGMRQRLALAQALLPDPELLILDEPTDGLDPEGLHEMRNLIRGLNQEHGLTILLASHDLSEVQQLCSHVAVLKQGELIFNGLWREAHFDASQIRIEVDRQAEAETGLVSNGLVSKFSQPGRAQLADGRTIADVTEWLTAHGYRVRSVTPVEPTLEDFYLQTTRARSSDKPR